MDTMTVVPDPDQVFTPLDDIHHDLYRPGIETVFNEFLDDGCRALDDFTGGDLIGHGIRKFMNAG